MSLRVASFKLVSSRWNPSHFTWNAAAENLENLVALEYSMTWGPQGSEDPRVDMSWVRNRFPAFSHFPARGPRAVENEHQFALILEKMDEEEEQQEEGLDQNEEPKPKVQNPLDLRYGYAVSVIAGVNVDLTPLRESIVGIPGIGILTKSDVIEAMDEPVLAEKVQKILSEEGAEVDPTTFSELLRVVLNRDAPDPPEELTQEPDDPISALLSIPRGPRRFHFSFDFPSNVDDERHAVNGGVPDAIFLVNKAPASSALPAETESSEELSPEEEEQRREEKQRAIAEGERRVALFEALKGMAAVERNPYKDTAFEVVPIPAAADGEEDPAAAAGAPLLRAMAATLRTFVAARLHYLEWAAGVPRYRVGAAVPPPEAADLRHYDRLLSALPHSALSVPYILGPTPHNRHHLPTVSVDPFPLFFGRCSPLIPGSAVARRPPRAGR